MNPEQHTHEWHVITAIEHQAWDDFMRYRGEEKDRVVTKTVVTHTLFCPTCHAIKSVKE